MLLVAIARKTAKGEWRPLVAFTDANIVEQILYAIEQANRDGVAKGRDSEIVIGFVYHDGTKSTLLGGVTDADLVRVAMETLRRQRMPWDKKEGEDNERDRS